MPSMNAANAQGSSETTLKRRFDYIDSSLAALTRKIQIQDPYLNLIERTNQQLSYGINFSAAFISALGVLFTIGSIIAGVMLFRQSKEYQKRVNDAIDDYRSIVNGFIEEKKVEIGLKIQELESRESTDEVSRNNIAREVKDLSALKDSLSSISTSQMGNAHQRLAQ